MTSHYRKNVTEFLLTIGHGDNSHVPEILKRRTDDLKVLQESMQLEMRFLAVTLSPLIEIAGHGGFALPGCLTRSSRQSQLTVPARD